MHNLTNYAILIEDGREVLKWAPLGAYETYKTKTTCALRFSRSFFYTKQRATRSCIRKAIQSETGFKDKLPDKTLSLIWTNDIELQAKLANSYCIVSVRITQTHSPELCLENFSKFVEETLKGSEWLQINSKTIPRLS